MALVGNIRVSTEVLYEKSNELKQIADELSNEFSEVNNLVNATQRYWIGKAGDSLRKRYTDMNADVLDILTQLKEYPVDLQKMAGVYVQHDSQAIQQASALPGDVLD